MSVVEAVAATLADALTEESELCDQLLGVTQREERAILASDIPALTALVEEKELLLELLATLETDRMTALTAIAAAIGNDASTLTITSVADLLEPGARGRLRAIGDDLKASGMALAAANAHNTQLLRSSTDLVERWLQYLKTVISGSLTYAPNGSTQGIAGNRVLDRSV